MEDASGAERYLIVPSCYIKEELDISNTAEEYDDETYYASNYAEHTNSVGAVDEQGMNADMVYQDIINQVKASQNESNGDAVNESSQICIKKEKSIPMEVDKESTESPEQFVDKSNSSNNMSTTNIAIMGEESDDTDVDVENTSSEDESITKSNNKSLQDISNAAGDSTWEHESSEDEDFELKISDEDGDKIKSSENGDTQDTSNIKVKDKSEYAGVSEINGLDSSTSEIKTYVTRNKIKNQLSSSQTADINSSNLSNESKQSNFQTTNEKIVTRYSLKGPEEKLEERKKMREARRSIKVNKSMIGYCLNCRTDVELTSCKNRNPCPQCKKQVKFKCTRCKGKNHVTDTYCGMHKHIQYHHIFKKKEKDNKSSNAEAYNSVQKSDETSPQKGRVNKRELILQDIEKFTILICLQCNQVARVYNGKISDCGGCKVKMVLTCLICSKYEASIYGMYEHLHQQHKEHFTDRETVKINPSGERISFVSKKRCLKCSKRFLSSGAAYKHAAICTKEPRVYQCNHCTYSTMIHGNLKKHCLNVHNKVVENTTTQNTLTVANPTTTAITSNQCQVCGKIIQKLESLKNHQKYCGIEPNIQCQFCSYKTKYKGNLNSHINQYHKSKSKSLPTEPIKTKVSSTVQEKSVISNKEQPNGFIANGNLSSFPTVKPLKEVAEALCLKCNESHEIVLTCREKQCNNCNHGIIYRCLICQKTYDHCQSLIYHLDSSCNPKGRYECKKCTYITYVSNTMQKHLRVHGVDPSKINTPYKRGGHFENDNEFVKFFKFPIDDSQSNHKSDLNTTPSNKPKVRIEPENTLKTQFQSSNSVNGLEKSPATLYNDNLNFKKQECPKCHIHVMSLKKHLRFCGIEANIKCKFCPYKTKYPFNLKTHMKNYHKGQNNKKYQ